MTSDDSLKTQLQLQGPRGICRDGATLVVDLQDYELPRFCVATGHPVEENGGTLIVKSFCLARSDSGDDAGFAGTATALFVRSYTAKLRVGAVREIAERLRRSNRFLVWGHRLIWIGVPIGLLGTVVSLIVRQFERQVAGTLLGLSLVASGLAVAFGGLLLWRRERFARISRRTGSILWLSGFHPDFLDHVPHREDIHEFATSVGTQIRAQMRHYFSAAAFLLVTGFVLVVFGIAGLREAISSQTWTAVPGTITSSGVRHVEPSRLNTGSQHDRYELDLTYSYVVQGVTRHGTRQRFGSAPYSSSPSRVDGYVRQYPVGKPVTVYYDARDPQRCSLARAEKPWLPFVWRLVPAAIGFIALSQGIRWWRIKQRWMTRTSP